MIKQKPIAQEVTERIKISATRMHKIGTMPLPPLDTRTEFCKV